MKELEERHPNFHCPREDLGGADGTRCCPVPQVGHWKARIFTAREKSLEVLMGPDAVQYLR